MSYRGRPSKGCELCRSKKVKCDETKPACNRCIKTGHECKYRDQSDLYFRNQTAVAAHKAEESWRKRSTKVQKTPGDASQSAQSPTPGDRASTSDPASTILNLEDLSIGQDKAATDLYKLAYDRFQYDFVFLGSADIWRDSDNVLDMLPGLSQNAPKDSLLNTVFSAVCFANLYQRMKIKRANVLAKEYCGRGLTLLRKALQDSEQQKSDETLMAVYLMGLWELLTSPDQDGSYLAHKEGANSLLLLRDPYKFGGDSIGARLYDMVFAQMLIGNFQSSTPPILVPKQTLEPTRTIFSLHLIHIVHRAVALNAEWRGNYPEANKSPKWFSMPSRKNPSGKAKPRVQTLLQAVLDLDAEYQAWEDTLPPTWHHQVVPNTPSLWTAYDKRWVDLILNSPGAPSELHIYPGLKTVWLLNFFRTARIFLVRDMLEMIIYMRENAHEAALDTPSLDTPLPLDALTLQIRQNLTISRLLKLINQVSSSVISHFTVKIPDKATSFPCPENFSRECSRSLSPHPATSASPEASAFSPSSQTSSSPFDVPLDDVIGMRVYTLFWPLAVVAGALKSPLLTSDPSVLESMTGAFDVQSRLSWVGTLLELISECGVTKAQAVLKNWNYSPDLVWR